MKNLAILFLLIFGMNMKTFSSFEEKISKYIPKCPSTVSFPNSSRGIEPNLPIILSAIVVDRMFLRYIPLSLIKDNPGVARTMTAVGFHNVRVFAYSWCAYKVGQSLQNYLQKRN